MLFQSLGSNYTLKDVIIHALTFSSNKSNKELRKYLNREFGGKKTITFQTGRAALSAGIKSFTEEGDGIIVNSSTCFVVIDAIKKAGCKPIYADIDEKTLNFNKNTISNILSEEVKGIIIQNNLGIAIDYKPILELAKEKNIKIIEDLAHSVGGSYDDGIKIGIIGDMTMLSFGRDKIIDTINGGALVIRNQDLTDKIQEPTKATPIIQQARDKIYPAIGWLARKTFKYGLGKYIIALSYKFKIAIRSADIPTNTDLKLPNWQSKLALNQLKNLTNDIKRRRSIQDKYLKNLGSISIKPSSNATRVPFLSKDRDLIISNLKNNKIFLEDIWYDVPVSPRRLYHLTDFSEKNNPVAVEISKQIFNLPTHKNITNNDINQIIKVIKNSIEYEN